MSHRILALLLLATAACGGTKAPPRPAAAKPAAAGGAAAVPPPAKAAPAEPEWVYTSVGKRDPFRSFLSEITKETGFASRCTTPVGRFGLEQLKLVAVITGLEDPVAMVEAPTGVGYAIRRGACIGRNGGVVAAVRTGEVVVTEWVIRADGTRDPAQTVLQLPKQQTLIPEE
jgi:type IV pilus assembly protein PilP